MERQKLIVGITGATGTIFGVRLLQLLQESNVETHLVMSSWGAQTLIRETHYTVRQVQTLASRVHPIGDQGAEISSGSAITLGMVIAPCSMKTLACIACGMGQNLIHRAADVILKERRKLVLLVRETPFNEIHLENMLKLSRMGAIIYPPVPSFYNRPESLDEMVTFTAARVLDQFGIHLEGIKRWDGKMGANDHHVEPQQITIADSLRRDS
jgi:4-hydroxy-3-polyprenylbenzoate decarboxylase